MVVWLHGGMDGDGDEEKGGCVGEAEGEEMEVLRETWKEKEKGNIEKRENSTPTP